jgi:Mg/Co/Ni transporter MgtE
VISPLEQTLDAWKSEKPITVDPLAPQDEVAYIIAKYDLLSVPVVEPETGKMLGIVTVDDALDTVLPTAWKKKLPRFF